MSIGGFELLQAQQDYYFIIHFGWLVWVGPLLARLAVGLLFFVSGLGKLANPEGMRQTLSQSGVPLAKFNSIFVPLVELVGGTGLILGLITPLWSFLLLCVMIVALTTVSIPNMKSTTLSAWLGEFLYLPEVLYAVILIWLLLAGPGGVSLDRLLIGLV